LRKYGQEGRVYIEFQTTDGSVELGFGELEPKKSDLILSFVSHPFRASPDRSDIKPLDKVLPDRNIVMNRTNEGTWWDETTGQQASIQLDGLLVRSMQHLGSTYFAPAEAQETLRLLFSTLSYLRATRMRPMRSYDDRVGKWQATGYAGEATAALLQERGGERTSFLKPPPIPKSVEEAKTSLERKWEDWQGTTIEAVSVWLQHLGLATEVASIRSPDNKRSVQVQVTLHRHQPHDITEVGFGVSQVLPVLVQGLMQPTSSLMIVDLPEAHLHPWPQARLADFFCSLVLSGRCALIETHSEVFFHRLRLRAEMDKSLSDQIAVYFMDEPRDGDCTLPRQVGLARSDQIRWPSGFLAEAWDTQKAINIIREGRGVRG